MSGNTTIATTNRVTLKVAGYVFSQFIDMTFEHDLENIAGRFDVTALDQNRIAAAFPLTAGQPPPIPIKLLAGQACELAIDGETILVGWLDKPSGKASGTELTFRFCGRDKTGDLVDCAALPNGPAEFRNLGLLPIAQQVAAPFGIGVRADVDTGAPFDRLSLQPAEKGLEFLEKAARQRAVLLTSDGLGNLLLTRGGSTRAPAPLRWGELIQDAEWEHDATELFSDWYVKGQTPLKRSGTVPALTSTAVPLSDPPTPPTTPATASAMEQSAVVMTGHAIDPEVKRYRPTVRAVKTQSGMSTVQEQAEWALRVAKGKADRITYTVLDWRAPNGVLWRPNQVAAVFDPYAGIDRDMLIAGVRYSFGKQGLLTKLRIVGVTAYDRINESIRQRHSKRTGSAAAATAPLTTTATPLTAP